jgi:hypothetical protein
VDEKHAHPQALRVLAGRRVIADVNVYIFACGDNARLIAAAPELLEALRDMTFDEFGAPTCWPTQERVMALIAKADGR